MKTNKVKYGPVFESQLKDLKQAILEKDMKIYSQLLVAIEREKDNLLLNPHKEYR